jgi:hypothetical protein
LKDLSDILKQAQQMQARLAEAQRAMEDIVAEGSAGGGLVRVTLRGKGALEGIVIDPCLAIPSEREILEDLIKAAHADARRKLEEALEATMQSAAGGLFGLPPGFKLPF